jgi:hypothetical protein
MIRNNEYRAPVRRTQLPADRSGVAPTRFQPAEISAPHLKAILVEKFAKEAVRLWTLIGYARMEEQTGNINLRHREAMHAELFRGTR